MAKYSELIPTCPDSFLLLQIVSGNPFATSQHVLLYREGFSRRDEGVDYVLLIVLSNNSLSSFDEAD